VASCRMITYPGFYEFVERLFAEEAADIAFVAEAIAEQSGGGYASGGLSLADTAELHDAYVFDASDVAWTAFTPLLPETVIMFGTAEESYGTVEIQDEDEDVS
jgi:hypothetical protein